MVQVIAAELAAPLYSPPGYYVRLRGQEDEVTGRAGLATAQRLAAAAGFDPEGASAVSVPADDGAHVVRSYLFFNCAVHHCVDDCAWTSPKARELLAAAAGAY